MTSRHGLRLFGDRTPGGTPGLSDVAPGLSNVAPGLGDGAAGEGVGVELVSTGIWRCPGSKGNEMFGSLARAEISRLLYAVLGATMLTTGRPARDDSLELGFVEW
jgi:hypothetical protein